MNDQQLFVITVPATLEETLVDWLAADSGTRGFTSVPAYGHHSDAREMTIAEQVSGRIRCAQFQIVCRPDEAAALAEKLRKDFAGADLRYWQLPLAASESLQRE